MCQWAALSEEERSAVHSRKRMLLKKDIALGVVVAPLLVVGGALKLWGLGNLLGS